MGISTLKVMHFSHSVTMETSMDVHPKKENYNYHNEPDVPLLGKYIQKTKSKHPREGWRDSSVVGTLVTLQGTRV